MTSRTLRGGLSLLVAVLATLAGTALVRSCASQREQEALKRRLEGVWTFQLADAVSDAQTFYAAWRTDPKRWEKVQSSIETLQSYREIPYEVWFDGDGSAAYRLLVKGEPWTMGTWKVGAREGEILVDLQRSSNPNVSRDLVLEWHGDRLFVYAGSLFFPLRHSEGKGGATPR